MAFSTVFRVSRLLIFAALALCFLAPSSYSQTVPKPKSKHPHHRAVVRHHVVRRKIHKAKAVQKPINVDAHMRHVPKPGSGGEEHSDWFWRMRGWPDLPLDAEYYQNALAQARALPVLSLHNNKDGILSSTNWQCIGPYSIDGRVTCVATHPTDSNIFYVGAASGGLWKTTDHGGSWSCVTDTFGSLSVGCVTIDPTDGQTIYLGLGECNESADSYGGDGLWKSTDGGGSWNYLGFASAQYIAKVIVDPRNRNDIFVAVHGTNNGADTTPGIFRSIDGGTNWTKLLAAPAIQPVKISGCNTGLIYSRFSDIAINPNNTGEIVASAWDHSLVLGPGFCPAGSGGPNTGIYRSIDTGQTWTRIDTIKGNGLPNGITAKVLGRIALLWTSTDDLFAGYVRVDTNAVTHLLIDENFEGLYRSEDEGATWIKVLDSSFQIPLGRIRFKDSSNLCNLQGGYDFYLAAGPTPAKGNPDIYIAGIDVLRSSDLGNSWKDITNSYSEYYVKNNPDQHPDQHGLAFTAAKSGTDMIMVNDGGVFHTTNFGASWKHVRGLPITMFYTVQPWEAGMAKTGPTISVSDLRLIGGTQDNGTVAHGFTPGNGALGTDSDFAFTSQGDGGVSVPVPNDTTKLISSAAIGFVFARNTMDSLMPNPLGNRDTTHDTLPRWHTISYHLLYGPNAPSDTSESSAFTIPIVLDSNKTDLFTARVHVFRAKLDWNDLENTKWYRWSPILAGNTADDSEWYYGDIESLAVGAHDAAGHPMLWAGGYSAGLSPRLWRTSLNATRSDTTAPKWVAIASGLPSSIISCIVPDRSDSLTAFASSSAGNSNGHVFITTNGKNWKNISGNLPATPVTSIAIDTLAEHGNPLAKNQCIIAGTDVGVFVTTNGGTNWAQLGEGMPHVIVDHVAIYKNMLVASAYGRSLWALDIGGLQAVPAVVAETPLAQNSLSIYPNPTRNSFVISNSIGGAITSVRLFDLSGGREFPVVLDALEKDSYRISFGSDVAPGTYLVEVFSGSEKVASGRVTIVR